VRSRYQTDMSAAKTAPNPKAEAAGDTA